MTRIPYTGLSLFACHKLTAVLFSEPLKFHFCPSSSPSCWRRFLGWRNLSSFTAPFQGCWSHPIFFFFSLYFILLGYMVIFLVILVSWDRLPAFSSYSVRIVPTCRCIFDVFVGGGELHVLLLHSLGLPVYLLFSYWWIRELFMLWFFKWILQMFSPAVIWFSIYVWLYFLNKWVKN